MTVSDIITAVEYKSNPWIQPLQDLVGALGQGVTSVTPRKTFEVTVNLDFMGN